jgi:hypothetical protein
MEEEGVDVKLVGNGAMIDLQGEQICMSYCSNRLDIEDCVIINGNIRFRGDNPHESAEPGNQPCLQQSLIYSPLGLQKEIKSVFLSCFIFFSPCFETISQC